VITYYSPWRNVDFQKPRFQFVIQKDVETKQLVAAVTASDVPFDCYIDVSL